jgi:NAD(P)-dependent dehydrogenase (short-subunit alcohol dehydrogenase family)
MIIENSVTIVTGAGSGIGRALAESFAAAGARVVVADIDAAAAEATTARITGRSQAAVGFPADASTDTGIRSLVDFATTEFGPVDIYVANAGVAGPSGLQASDLDWDHVLNVNLRAHIRAATLLVPGWRERGGGYFVSTASAAGLLTQIGAAAYAVSKHAAVGFAEWLAISYGDNGIGVSCVCPMGVSTALLNTARESSDTGWQLATSAIINAAPVIGPELVADITVDAVREGRFLVLPHPEALDMFRQKGADYEQWITGMRRYQRSLANHSSGHQ